MKISGVTAWESVAGNPSLQWGSDFQAFDHAAYPVAYSPKFKVDLENGFFV
jgi:hypothetical protein